MGRSSKSSHEHRRVDGKDIKSRDSDEGSHDRKKRNGDRGSHRRRQRSDDKDDSEDEKYNSKRHESKSHRRDEKRSKGHKKDRETSHDRHKRGDNERHRHHSRRHPDSGDERLEDSRKAKRNKRNREDDDDKQGKSRKHKHASHHDRKQKEFSVEPTILEVNKGDLFPLGEKLGHPPDTLIDPENDYFEQNQRLRLYLYRECGMTFDDLSTDVARKMFHEFAQRYNVGDLELGYYSGMLPAEAVDQCPSTRHQWSLKMSSQDAQNLQLVQMGIRKQTEYQAHSSAELPNPDSNLKPEIQRNEEATRLEPSNDRDRNRRRREEARITLEEFTGGRAEGRERLIEKRQERASQIHGATKYAPEVELDDAALYGGGSSDDFRRALAASRKRAAAQETQKEARVRELQQKEEEKKSAMLQKLGLSHMIGQSKIKIPPRNDPP